MKQFSKKLSLAAASALGCVALFGCGSSDSNNTTSATDSTFDSDVEAVNLCGDYTTYEDGLGNTYCMDLATGAVVYSVMADGTIVYATVEGESETNPGTGVESSASTGDTSSGDTSLITSSGASTVVESSTSTASNAVCGETTNPTSIVWNLYFYSDAQGSYYYNMADASCTKVYLMVASSSSAAVETSSATVQTSSTSNPWMVSSSSVATVTSSATVVVMSSASVESTGSTPSVTFSTSGASVENNNNCVSIEGSVVTVLCAGNYYFAGTSNNGQIIVAAPTSDKVYLFLNGLTLTSSDAPIYAQSSDKTFIVAVSGTTNTLTDGSSRSNVYSYTKDGESKTDTTGAAIYAKDDLTIKGSGTLKVTGNYNNGIQTAKDLKVKYDDEFGGAPTITVTAKNNAFKGKNSVEIDGGVLNFTATSGDGIKSDEDDATEIAEGKGRVLITGGTITVKAGDDGIQASNYFLIDDSVSVPKLTVNASGKAVKTDSAGGSIYVYAGTMDLTSTADDGLHSNADVFLEGGTVTISAGDDGVHAETNLNLNGSTVYVKTATEAFEGYYIYANAGITAVYGTDDGWNAAGGSTSTSTSSGWGGNMGGGMSSSVGHIVISGGYHYISASGNDVDVLDANGTATQTGGVLILEMPSSSGTSSGGNMGGGSFGGNTGSTGGSCSINGAGGLIDTDNGYSITGGVMLGFGSQTEEYPNCTATSYTNSNYYGSSNAAFKPQGSGSMILYGGSVTSVSTVDVSSMTAVNFPNGLTYYYK